MIQRLRHDWLAWLLLLGALAALLGPLRLLAELGQPFGGYITFQRAASATNEVDGNTPSWWSGLGGDKVQHGDRLITIDGLPHATSARGAYLRAYENQIETVLIDTGQNAESELPEIPVRTFTILDFLDVRLPDLITGFVLWLAGVIVYMARPDQPANRAFATATAVAGYGRLLYVHTIFFDDSMAVALELQLQFWLCLLGPAMLFLAFRFPDPSKNRLAQPLLILSCIMGVVAFFLTFFSRMESLPISTRMVAGEVAYNLTIILLYFSVAALFIRLFAWFFRSRNTKRDRRIAIILILGWLLTMPPIIASGLNALQLGDGSSYYFLLGIDLRYMFLFAPLAFAYVLVRYHAMQAPSPLFIFLMVLTTSAIVAALLAWIWSLTGQFMPDADSGPPFLTLFIAALSVGVFWTTIAKLPQLLGRTLAWDHYSNASAREFGRRVNENLDLSRTPETIAQAIVDEFELEQSALWLVTPGSNDFYLAAQAGDRLTDLPQEIAMNGRELASRSYPFRPALITQENAPWGPGSPEAQGIEVVVPLAMENRLLGLMGLGMRWDEDVFDSRNLDIFEIVGQQATLLLDVTQHVQELQRVPGQLVDAQERERLKLARELHDTVQQFLGGLPFLLAVSRDSFESNPAKASEIIDSAIVAVEEAAQAVRQIRHNLAPSQLERGLEQALVTLTTNFQRRANVTATLSMPTQLDASTTLESRQAIYRVIEQALNNVQQHAAAANVSVQLYIQDGRIHFSVVDDGQGSSVEARQVARAKGSFGIESMTARLAATGGGLTILSAPGYGLEVKGWVPVLTEIQTDEIESSGRNMPEQAAPIPVSPIPAATVIGENPQEYSGVSV